MKERKFKLLILYIQSKRPQDLQTLMQIFLGKLTHKGSQETTTIIKLMTLDNYSKDKGEMKIDGQK